jgi:hypothetical protein
MMTAQHSITFQFFAGQKHDPSHPGGKRKMIITHTTVGKANVASPPIKPAKRNARVLSYLLLLVTLVSMVFASMVIAPMRSASAANTIKITKATFAKEVTADFQAKNATTNFYGTDTVYLLLQIKGRPKKGIVESRWAFRGDDVARASVDLVTVNKGTLFSFGESTFVKFFLKPDANGLPVGTSYTVDIFVNGAKTDRYKFQVIPPKGSLATKLISANTAKSEKGPAATKFAPTDTIYLQFKGNFGVGSWIEAQWSVNGVFDPEGTKSLSITKDASEVDGNFSYLPGGGWVKGNHSVALYVNDKVAGSYAFTVE